MTIRARQDAIIRTLRRTSVATVSELAVEVGVSRRTVLRDIVALRDQGFVIHSECGPGGGLHLDPSSLQTASQVSVVEVFALLISVATMRDAQTFPFADVADAGPITGRWRVRAISDGRFTESQPRHGGATAFDQGLTAVLVHVSGLTVMATTRRMAPFSLGQLRHAGLDPASFTHLVAKGVHAPVAAYGEVCSSFVRVDTPGVTSANLGRLTYRHRRRPLHPFER